MFAEAYRSRSGWRLPLCFLSACILVFASGCKEPSKGPLQINDSGIFVSSNPIRPDSEVTFELKPSEEALRNIEAHLQSKFGPEGISIREEDGSFRPLSKIAVKNSSIEQRVSVKQGASVLYETKQMIHRDNLRQIAPILLKSAAWKNPPSINGGDVEFKVEYLLFWEHDTLGSGWTSIKMDSCQIPVAHTPPSDAGARVGESRFHGLDLRLGMSRQQVEEKVAALVDKPGSYSPHGNNLKGGVVQYLDGSWILEVRYEAGAPAPYVAKPDGTIEHLQPIDETLKEFRIIK